MHTEDGNIIHECINGDSASFGLLVDKYKASIFALAYSRLNNFHDAEDVTQEVFLKAYKSLRTLRQWDNFVVWLRSVTINLCKNKIREQSRKRDKFSIKDQNSEIIENASLDSYREEQSSSWRNEALDSLDEALNSLPEEYRQILTLYYLGGMKGEEISKFLSISHDTVRQRLSRARAMLKEEVLAMISTNYGQQKLSASFTFRIIEMVKKIRIQPTSGIKGLPYGLSIGAGIIFAILSFGQHIQINLSDIAMGLPLPSDTKVLKVGEIPVDAVKISAIASIGDKGNGKGVAPDPKGQANAFFMVPQAEGGTWTKRADMPTARDCAVTAVVNGKIYAIGGWQPADIKLSNVEEYDPVKDKWEIKSNMLEKRMWFTASSTNSKIYVFGGIDERSQILSSVEEYDPVLDKWKKKRGMPKFLKNLTSCALGTKIYIMGGFNGIDFDTMYEYDTLKDSWTEKASMFTARSDLCACAVNGKIYAIGGSAWNGDVMVDGLSTVEKYNPTTNTWTKSADMATARGMLVACAVGDKIYVLGGTKTDSGAGLSTVEIYNTLSDTWTKGVDMITPKWAFAASAVDRKIYSIGGYSNSILSNVEEFDTGINESKSVDPSEKLPKTWGMLKAK